MTAVELRRVTLGSALILAGAAAAFVVSAAAQHPHKGSHPGHGPVAQPYAGLDARRVASLSDNEVAGILDGKGMGYALPAELNGYPGPMHILELADRLKLSDSQRAAVEALFVRMKERAREVGRRYVDAEAAVGDAFRAHADRATIVRLVESADQLRAQKRLAHLEAHIDARALLTEEQLKLYAELRGYGSK